MQKWEASREKLRISQICGTGMSVGDEVRTSGVTSLLVQCIDWSKRPPSKHNTWAKTPKHIQLADHLLTGTWVPLHAGARD